MSYRRSPVYEKFRKKGWPHPPYKRVQDIFKFPCVSVGEELIYEGDLVAIKLAGDLQYNPSCPAAKFKLGPLRFGVVKDLFEDKGRRLVSWKALRVAERNLGKGIGKVPELVDTEEEGTTTIKNIIGKVVHLDKKSIESKRYGWKNVDTWRDLVFLRVNED